MKGKQISFQSRQKKDQEKLLIEMKLMEGELRALLEMLEQRNRKTA